MYLLRASIKLSYMLVGISVSFNSLKYNFIKEAITGRSMLSSSNETGSPIISIKLIY